MDWWPQKGKGSVCLQSRDSVDRVKLNLLDVVPRCPITVCLQSGLDKPSWRQQDPSQLSASLLKTTPRGINWCRSFRTLICHVDGMGKGTHHLLPRRGHHLTAGWSWAGSWLCMVRILATPPPWCRQVPGAAQLTPRVPEQPVRRPSQQQGPGKHPGCAFFFNLFLIAGS